MDAKILCLGLLSFGEASGYDLKQHAESAGYHFFASGFGSIYPALSALMKNGLIERVSKPREGRRDRKVYRITPAGRSELIHLLSLVEPRHVLRSDLFALLYFSHLVTPGRIAQVIDERLIAIRADLEATKRSDTTLKHPSPPSVRFVSGLKKALLETILNYFRDNRALLER